MMSVLSLEKSAFTNPDLRAGNRFPFKSVTVAETPGTLKPPKTICSMKPILQRNGACATISGYF